MSPANGSQDDFTLGGHHDALASITDPVRCGEVAEEGVHAIYVTTAGADADVETAAWINDRLLPEFDARGIVRPGRGLGECTHEDTGEPIGGALITTDWAQADPIVQTVVDVAQEDDVAVNLVIVIEPVVSSCPDVACGA